VAWSDGMDPASPAYGIAASTAKRMRVIAGPGTGKSFAMKRRVARLLEEGVKPREILSVTFTRVAAEAQRRFSMFKLFLQPQNRVALRYLLGEGGTDHRAPAYAKLLDYCGENSISPRDTLERLASGEIQISGTKVLVDKFTELAKELAALQEHGTDLERFVDHMFPDGDDLISELRRLAVDCLQSSENPEELLREMMRELTQPEIPPTINDVRVMSLNKSKGLSSPYVFIAGCYQGLLPRKADGSLSKSQQEADLEEQRRLFYVGITRVKADVANGRPGSLFLTHSQKMSGGVAKQCGIEPASSSAYFVNLLPSIFLAELGKSAPKAVAG
jgi:DNA helicase-2/ATP-dependent DNA helicase PcrA